MPVYPKVISLNTASSSSLRIRSAGSDFRDFQYI